MSDAVSQFSATIPVVERHRLNEAALHALHVHGDQADERQGQAHTQSGQHEAEHPAGGVCRVKSDNFLHGVRRPERKRQQASDQPPGQGDQDGGKTAPGTEVEDPELDQGIVIRHHLPLTSESGTNARPLGRRNGTSSEF